MRRIRNAAAAVGLAGALSLGALVAVPAFADSDDATVNPPVGDGQVVDDGDEVMPNPNCTGTQQRDRDGDHVRAHMQDRDWDDAQMWHQHGLANGHGREPGSGNGPGPGAGTGDRPYAPDAD